MTKRKKKTKTKKKVITKKETKPAKKKRIITRGRKPEELLETPSIKKAKKSKGHICFACHQMVSQSLKMHVVTDDCQVNKEVMLWEFFYEIQTVKNDDDRNLFGNTREEYQYAIVYKADARKGIKDGKRLDNMVVSSGAYGTVEMCKRLGVEAPAQLLELIEYETVLCEEDKKRIEQGKETMAKKKTNKKKTGSKRSGTSVAQHWCNVIQANEKAAKKNRLTDAGMIKAMQKLCPANKNATTITRFPRGIYNTGTNMFKGMFNSVKANGNNRPICKKYGEDGNEVVAGAKKKTASKKTTTKKTSKKKVTTKKKKTTKKAPAKKTPAKKKIVVKKKKS